MLTFASIIIPFAPYHSHLVGRAISSAEAQTLPCQIIPVEDLEGRGVSWARNYGASLATSPFLIFLDADDLLMPNFTEQTLLHWKQGHYVYTDWSQNGHTYTLPDFFPQPNTIAIHLNTCLISSSLFRSAGGYREGLAEDTEFYLRLMSRGVCGIRCPLPLIEYTEEGQRSSELRNVENDVYLKKLYERYYSMSDCNCGEASAPPPPNKENDNDILVSANWGYNRARVGEMTGRKYPYTGHGKLLYVDPRDAAAQPDLFPLVEPPLMDDAEEVDITAIKEKIVGLAKKKK